MVAVRCAGGEVDNDAQLGFKPCKQMAFGFRRALKRESSFVFVTERRAPFTRAGFAKMIARAGQEAGFKFGVHPHMLRHACGYTLANKGVDTRSLQAYLGHRNIQHTVRYSELSPTRFNDFWRA